jgi:ElaB/YqjD/DUF883 family membrane-anchored ribosome-binding protein
MAKANRLQSEIDDLRNELEHAAEVAKAKVEDLVTGEGFSEVQDQVGRLLDELKTQLTEATEDVEDIVTEHPLAAIGVAFALGIYLGRMLGHRS